MTSVTAQPSASRCRGAKRLLAAVTDNASLLKILVLLPAGLCVTAAVLWPLLLTIFLSFTDLRGLNANAFELVGFDNYLGVLTSQAFWSSSAITLKFALVSVAAQVVLGVLVALLLNQKFPGRNFVRILLVVPWALPTVVNAVVWRLIFAPDYGVANAVLTSLGLIENYQSWLGNPTTALWYVAFADVWKNFPIVCLIVLAALQAVPKELREAATVDGARGLDRFQVVIWPYIVGPLAAAATLRLIEAMRAFDIVWLMTRGGPADSTKTLGIGVYQEIMAYQNIGTGSSFALIVALISMILVASYLRIMSRVGKV